MIKTLRYLFLILLIGCGETEKKSNKVVFAGEIVNPTSEYVVLYKGDDALDSILLDEQNRFSFSLDSVSEGLHHFYHHPEFQYMYLEAGDSLQVRLNTMYFDESLVFSGQGEEVNNFLLEMFLANEEEEDLVYSYYRLEALDFEFKIDSLREEKLSHLQELVKETQLSENAYEIAKANIVYSSNIYKEAYPFYHKRKTGNSTFKKLPQGFYDYRKQIDYSDEDLTYLRPYYNFMKYHLGNLSFMGCKKDCDSENDKIANQLHINRHKLQLIDSLIQQKELRDNLFRNVAVDYLLKHDKEENNIAFINEFHDLSGNNKHIEEINKLYEGIRSMQPNKDLPNLVLHNVDGQEVSIKEICKDKQVVFYFWSAAEQGHFKNIIKRVAKLKIKYPQYEFVGINLRTDEPRWKSMVENNQLAKEEQFWASNFTEIAHTLIVYDPNKSIIAKDGKIVDAFANVYSSFD